ncbi:serine/threonine-protein kinase [Tengunoibacter tsumagoiensis]|uniref:non-specific serine/threonine protein kinase n=1 Tax=Tengunoibacter tsumagoiensis TaxID=2014871 RepID=A0A401ZWW7_9CHLR|nr:serine/threonine-protein kinase [Tengunoibacter tsumagoiensis]GCE11365.1 hypothetical protein KTT_12240 [Tengunoibacter tsumagoiensis]
MSVLPPYLDKYQLLERLGRGGAAEVWKALDTQLERFVAIKILHPDLQEDEHFIERFQREARLVAALRHPNIVSVHEFRITRSGEDTLSPRTFAYMVMDYIEGQSLGTYMQASIASGQLPTPIELVNLFTSLGLAIDYAHSHGVIHRDIKPANIMLDSHYTERNLMGEPILTDFGIARMMNSTTSTQTNSQIGTPFYLAPEQLQGYPGNEQSDLYALGVILYEMVTGSLPFRGETPLEMGLQQFHADPVSPITHNAQISPALSVVILKSLSRDPGARFSSAAALTSAIAEALQLPAPDVLGPVPYPLNNDERPTLNAARSQLEAETVLVSPPDLVRVKTEKVVMPDTMVAHVSKTPASRIPTQLMQPQPPSSPVVRSRPARVWPVLISIVLVLLLGGGGIGLFVFHPASSLPFSGRVFYLSSGQISMDSAQGIADELQIELQNVPSPHAGKRYYVWLLGDAHSLGTGDLVGANFFHLPLLLPDTLTITNGQAHLLYQGDGAHHNLLAQVSRLLITEEDAGKTPEVPTNDRSRWRYFAALPQTNFSVAGSSTNILLHLRHLLYSEANINELGLQGGLNIWLFRNTEKILEWSVSARDDWKNDQPALTDLMKNQFIRILDYVDGSANVYLDLPDGTPLLTDPTSTRIPLLTINPNHQSPSGYVNHVLAHLNQILKSPDVTSDMVKQARLSQQALTASESWLTDVRADVNQLFRMAVEPARFEPTTARLLLDDLVTKATYAYIGKLDPATNQVQPGVMQAFYAIQQLATLEISTSMPASL